MKERRRKGKGEKGKKENGGKTEKTSKSLIIIVNSTGGGYETHE